jgi:hypothetical protein
MRLTILPLVALAVAPAPTADACGYVTPAVFLVSVHNFRAEHAPHALVRIADGAPARLPWERVDPMGYDASEIAPAPRLDQPMTFTIVSPTATRVVSSRVQRFLAQDMWSFDAPNATTVDIGDVGDGFRIALAGSHDDATLRALTTGRDGKAQIELADVGRIEAVTSVTTEETTTLTRDGRDMGTYPGTVAGELETGGLHYIVIAHRGNARAVAIW